MFVLLMFLAGCATSENIGVLDLEERFQREVYDISIDHYIETAEDIITIGERFFVNQMMEIFMNYNQYLGRTLQFEGIFQTYSWNDNDFHLVIRYMLGCCSPEEMIGFEILMDENFGVFEDDAWVEVTGVLDLDDDFLVIRVTNIVELEERGMELVF